MFDSQPMLLKHKFNEVITLGVIVFCICKITTAMIFNKGFLNDYYKDYGKIAIRTVSMPAHIKQE